MTRRHCSFCGDRARYVYDPDDAPITDLAMCYWHLLLFYLGFDLSWRA